MPEDKWGCGVAIVDDETTLVDLFQKLLKQHDIPVCFTAYDGDEAVGKFKMHNRKPRVVLMDYRLPTVNGIEATREILGICPETKVIFLSADSSVMDEALKAGAVKFLQKPASMREVLGIIKSVVQG